MLGKIIGIIILVGIGILVVSASINSLSTANQHSAKNIPPPTYVPPSTYSQVPVLVTTQKIIEHSQIGPVETLNIDGRSIDLQSEEFGKESAKRQLISDAIDYQNTITIDYARNLVKKSSAGDYNLAQICDIWEYAKNNWIYVNDPHSQDYYSSASNSIKIGLKGDCDDFAILNAAIVEAIGGSSRVITASDNNGNGHAYAEVYIGTSQDDVKKASNYICSRYLCDQIWTHHETDNQGVTRYWLNLDWSAGHPGGPYTAENNKEYYSPADDLYYVKPLVPAAPTITISSLEFTEFEHLSFAPTPTPTIDWSNLNKVNLLTPTPTPTIDFSKIYRI